MNNPFILHSSAVHSLIEIGDSGHGRELPRRGVLEDVVTAFTEKFSLILEDLSLYIREQTYIGCYIVKTEIMSLFS